MNKLDFGTGIERKNNPEEVESVVFNYDLVGVRRTYGGGLYSGSKRREEVTNTL